MSEQFRQLQRLRVEQPEVNQELARAAVGDLAARVIAAGSRGGSPPGNVTLPVARQGEETRHLPPRLMPLEWHPCPPGGALRAEALSSLCKIFLHKSCRTRFLRKLLAMLSASERSLRISHDMLRITTNENPQALTLRLEGRLEGPWVEVLTESWHGALTESATRRRCVDLNGVTFIDGQGKARLAQMHAQGAEFIADDLMTRAIVAEIVGKTGRKRSQIRPEHNEGRSR